MFKAVLPPLMECIDLTVTPPGRGSDSDEHRSTPQTSRLPQRDADEDGGLSLIHLRFP
ncbi:hypothetical protein F2Q69_00013979 [Brassica cretica]|uniref:Uncharacterized protein n=1 Tax=Brassica cretica TaxID=69181 RepID=A0A8S9R283_BRACR|nr:hypothetical protein F2Q69_00013979 [Brassica cretica]